MASEISRTPFAEPPWLRGLPSANYTESHRRWQRQCREFVGKTLVEEGANWELEGDIPAGIWEAFTESHMLLACLQPPLPVRELHSLGITELPGGVKIEDFDYIHSAIFADELGTPK
jgi:acyl-CoA dehydrogenase